MKMSGCFSYSYRVMADIVMADVVRACMAMARDIGLLLVFPTLSANPCFPTYSFDAKSRTVSVAVIKLVVSDRLRESICDTNILGHCAASWQLHYRLDPGSSPLKSNLLSGVSRGIQSPPAS